MLRASDQWRSNRVATVDKAEQANKMIIYQFGFCEFLSWFEFITYILQIYICIKETKNNCKINSKHLICI